MFMHGTHSTVERKKNRCQYIGRVRPGIEPEIGTENGSNYLCETNEYILTSRMHEGIKRKNNEINGRNKLGTQEKNEN